MNFIRNRALLKKRSRRTVAEKDTPTVPSSEPSSSSSSSSGSHVDKRTMTDTIAIRSMPIKPINTTTTTSTTTKKKKQPLLSRGDCASPDSVTSFPTHSTPPILDHDAPPVMAVSSTKSLELMTPRPIPSTPQTVRAEEELTESSVPSEQQLCCVTTSPILVTSPVSQGSPRSSCFSEQVMTIPPTMKQQRTRVRKKQVSFIDDLCNIPLHEIRIIERAPSRRLLLLLLCPVDRKFEFLNLEYPLDDNTTAQVLVDQIPKLASNPVFRKFTFTGLARTSVKQLLENDQLMGDFELKENELVLGVPLGYQDHQIGAFAVPLLLNGDIIKAVKLARKSGKGLKTVLSGNEWKRRGKAPRAIPKSSTSRRISIEEWNDHDDHNNIENGMEKREQPNEGLGGLEPPPFFDAVTSSPPSSSLELSTIDVPPTTAVVDISTTSSTSSTVVVTPTTTTTTTTSPPVVEATTTTHPFVEATATTTAPPFVEASTATPTFAEDATATSAFVEATTAIPAFLEATTTTPLFVKDTTTTPPFVEATATTPAVVDGGNTTLMTPAPTPTSEAVTAAPTVVTEPISVPPSTTVATTTPMLNKLPSKTDLLQASFSDCKAELSRLAALEPRPMLPPVKSMARPGSHEDLMSLESNARSVVDQLIRRAGSCNNMTDLNNDFLRYHPDAVMPEQQVEDIPSLDICTSENYYSSSGLDYEDDYLFMEGNDDDDDDHDNHSTMDVPDLVHNMLGGTGTDKVVLLIHAVSIAAVGYFANLMA